MPTKSETRVLISANESPNSANNPTTTAKKIPYAPLVENSKFRLLNTFAGYDLSLDNFEKILTGNMKTFKTGQDNRNGRETSKVVVEVEVNGTSYQLNMQDRCSNQNALFADNFKWLKNNKTMQFDRFKNCECFLFGNEIKTGEAATADICYGSAMFSSHGDVFEVVPETNTGMKSFNQRVKIVTGRLMRDKGQTCGTKSEYVPIEEPPAIGFRKVTKRRNLRVSWAVDEAFKKSHGEQNWFNYLQRILNSVKHIYNTELLTNIISSQIVEISDIPNPDERNSVAILNAFRFYARTNLGLPTKGKVDVAHLISGRVFLGGLFGLAHVGSACSPFGAAVSSDRKINAFTIVNTISHEIGHNLNLAHVPFLQCSAPGSRCIMNDATWIASASFGNQSRLRYDRFANSKDCLSVPDIPAEENMPSKSDTRLLISADESTTSCDHPIMDCSNDTMCNDKCGSGWSCRRKAFASFCVPSKYFKKCEHDSECNDNALRCVGVAADKRCYFKLFNA